MKMIKQFIPQEVCLKCQGCCRFSQETSLWLPCLLDEEIQDLLGRDIPPASISIDKKIQLVPHPGGDGFICPFLDITANKCKIYASHFFECQLYPFLIALQGKKVLLTIDLNCLYIREKINTKELKDYTQELVDFLNTPAQLEILKDNPQIIQVYEEVLEVVELKIAKIA